ncbi:hypothetical protein FIBSPDRAFT_904577 [Athelia psychrophila]|uniref:Uncharacterized protein n=1 Tax=Athelia psychrophila TaxID=1759441 RepID=A0A167UKK1_9AGAM|nr:hypothetical protein FIBSPDRAFT_904577 [Fibularhizoctonia sp. CBS 109695]
MWGLGVVWARGVVYARGVVWARGGVDIVGLCGQATRLCTSTSSAITGSDGDLYSYVGNDKDIRQFETPGVFVCASPEQTRGQMENGYSPANAVMCGRIAPIMVMVTGHGAAIDRYMTAIYVVTMRAAAQRERVSSPAVARCDLVPTTTHSKGQAARISSEYEKKPDKRQANSDKLTVERSEVFERYKALRPYDANVCGKVQKQFRGRATATPQLIGTGLDVS